MVSMAIHNTILKNGVVSTKSTICQLLLNLEYKIRYRLEHRHRPCIIRQLCKLSDYVNNLICIFIILIKCYKILGNHKEITLNVLISVQNSGKS